MVLLVAAATWSTVLDVNFDVDEYYFLFLLEVAPKMEFLFRPFVGHIVGLMNAGIWLCHSLFGLDPRGYQVLLLVIHLVNTGLLFRISFALWGSIPLATFVALVWGVSASHAGSLERFAMIGTLTGIAIVLAILLVLINMGAGKASVTKLRVAGIAVALCVASLGAGMALAAALTLPLMALAFAPAERKKLAPLLAMLIVLPVSYLLLHQIWPGATGTTWDDPVATVASGLGSTVLKLPEFMLDFFAAGFAALFSVTEREIATSGIRQLGALFLMAVVALAAVKGSITTRNRIVAWGLLALATYGVVAVARVGIQDIFPQISFISFARYHYLPTLVLSLLLAEAAAPLIARLPVNATRSIFYGGSCLVALVVLSNPPQLDTRDQLKARVDGVVAGIREDILAAPKSAPIILDNPADFGTQSGLPLHTTRAGIFVIFFDTTEFAPGEVKFYASPQELAEAQRYPDSRLSELLVPLSPQRSPAAN